MHPEFEKLIALAYSDGVLTEDEKHLLLSKANELGIDKTEAELQIMNYRGTNEVISLKKEINSIEELEHFLEDIQSSSSPSWQSALDAQLQVLSYVHSSELVGTTLDSLFKSIKAAKKQAKDEVERTQIMERGSIFIQNFVFFMHAKLLYAVDKNRKQGKELQKKAAKILMKSVSSAASQAAGGPQAVAIQFGNNIIDEIVESDVFDRFIDYFNKKAENARREAEFLKSMASLFDKLDRHFDTIGNCDVIAGLLRNYGEKVARFQTKEIEETLDAQVIQVTKSKTKIWSKPLIVFGISSLIYLVRWIWHGVINAEKFIENLIEEDTTSNIETSLFTWTEWHFLITLLILALVAITYSLTYRKNLNVLKDLEKSSNNYLEELLSKYEQTASKYDE